MANTNNQPPYFPHSANTRNEDKLVKLRLQLGVAGYGVYMMLLERLRMSENYQCSLDLEVLSWDFDCDEDLIRAVIFNFDLFEIICEGAKFQSIELCAYMEYMEEKKRTKAEAARAAANARWGNEPSDSTDQKVVNNANIEKGRKSSEVEPKYTLDQEIELMKKNSSWLSHVCSNSRMTTEHVLSYMDQFKEHCICHGEGDGHKSLQKAMNHFFCWLIKYYVSTNEFKSSQGNREARRIARNEEERKLRIENYERMEKNKITPDNYIRNKGYDPAEVSMAKLMRPGWMENNPPTHPEWIGKYGKRPVPEYPNPI